MPITPDHTLAKDVAEMAKQRAARIAEAAKQSAGPAFGAFLADMKGSVDAALTEKDAIEALALHSIAAPVFDALFEGCKFAESNAVSKAMERALAEIGANGMDADCLPTLNKFCQSAQALAKGAASPGGITEPCNNFFKAAFPRLADMLGIAYTPIEVADFIIHSANDALRAEFGKGLTDENINILDPFAGAGTFIARLIQSGLIEKKDLARKYQREIFANDKILLTYYIACANIESAYRGAAGAKEHGPFEGIALADTFQAFEGSFESAEAKAAILGENSGRLKRQGGAPLAVIFGNPTISVDRRSASDDAQNSGYPHIDRAIENAYAAHSRAIYKKALYDSYIRAFRYATDRLGDDGIICFVTNGGWLEGSSTAGFRKSIEKEFAKIYVFNLRGNQRTSGDTRRREGGNVFDGGYMAPIAITLLVKKKGHPSKAEIWYKDIGPFLDREEKLELIAAQKSFLNPALHIERLAPDEHGDWLSKRDPAFQTFVPLMPKKKFDEGTESLFVVNSLGTNTSHDPWVYNFSYPTVADNAHTMIHTYNSQIGVAEDKITHDPTQISWNRALLADRADGRKLKFEEEKISLALYRPFNKQHLYQGEGLIHKRGQFELFFPNPGSENMVIVTSGGGGTREFSCLMANHIVDLHFVGDSQCFPLYWYDSGGGRRDGISDSALRAAREKYGANVSKEDIFAYAYALLHHPKYRRRFADDLKKSLPRIPFVTEPEGFFALSGAGWELAELHLNYEDQTGYLEIIDERVPKRPGLERGTGSFGEDYPPEHGDNVSFDQLADDRLYDRTAHYVVKLLDYGDCFPELKWHERYLVDKIRFPKKGRRDAIIYNKYFAIANIPELAYQYVVNGKSAIEWVMERYQVKTDKDSGLTNDPNLYADEMGRTSYILDLLLSVISVSVNSAEIMHNMPDVDF